MSKEIVITTPGRKEHSGVLLANAMAKSGFDIKVSDTFEIIGDKETQDAFFDLSDTPEMTMVFWALSGSGRAYLDSSPFLNRAAFPFQTKERLKALAEKRKPMVAQAELSTNELNELQGLVSGFVKQQVKKRPA